jgi:dipeptidyl aminopeptidase/acylaminoacyl peptidase
MIHRGEIRRNLSPDEASSSINLREQSLRQPQVGELDIDGAPNLRGYLALPKDYKEGERYPGLIILGGSEGGIWKRNVGEWADRGYVALGVAHHRGRNAHGVNWNGNTSWCALDDWGGVPDDLANISINQFQSVIKYLSEHRGVLPRAKPALLGASRGGELALLLGETYPDSFAALCAIVPSRWANGAFSANGATQQELKNKSTPAWILDDGMILNRDIDITNIQCPIFVASAGDDDVWQYEEEHAAWYQAQGILSARNSDSNPTITKDADLIKFENKKGDVGLHFPRAGHYLSDPYDDTRLLHLDALINFLERHMSPDEPPSSGR